MATRRFSSISVETTLASGISSVATSMTVANNTGAALIQGSGFVNGDQFYVAIDPDTVNEELVTITAVSSDTFTIARGQAGSSAISHSGGATVRHVLTGDDLTSFETTSLNAVTLTGTQTLTNKTLTAPKFANGGFIADNNGNEQIKFGTTASAVNEITVTNAATGNAPAITPTGNDSNISLSLAPKGTGSVQIDRIAPKFADGGFIADNNGNEQIKFATTVAAVNEITVTNAATGNNPSIAATGSDSNINLNLVSKGTGKVLVNGQEISASPDVVSPLFMLMGA